MLALALPVVISYLGIMAMGLVDLIAVGHVSPVAVGAAGMANSLFSWFLIFGLGLLGGLDYLASFAHGAGRKQDGHLAFQQALIVILLMGPIAVAVLLGISRHLEFFAVNPAVLPATRAYLGVITFSLLPILVFAACRQNLQARGIARPTMVVLIFANILNIALNYCWVFGHGGFRAHGMIGSAWATVVSRFFNMLGVVGYLVWHDRRGEQLFARIPFRLHAKTFRRLIGLGFPSALQQTFEIGVFAFATLLAAKLQTAVLAAHQIVLNIASMTFMVPLGIASATAVLVGQAMGRGELPAAAKRGWQGLAMGCGFMAFSCGCLIAFPHPILSIYTHDPAILFHATTIIGIAALFQVSDGAQTVLTGALRGLGETKIPAVLNLIGHWFFGLPLGAYLCFRAGFGLKGLWIGLSAGLTVVAIMLILKWISAIRGHAATSDNTYYEN